MNKTKKKSKRWTEDEARHILREHQESGESIAAFAKCRGLVAERLYRWQRKLERRGEGARAGKRSRSGEMRFAEVAGVVQRGAVNGAAASERFEVELSGGRRIWVPSGFDEQDMRRLVAVLEGARC